MTLAIEDVKRIAHLGLIEIDEDQAVRMQSELNDIYALPTAFRTPRWLRRRLPSDTQTPQ